MLLLLSQVSLRLFETPQQKEPLHDNLMERANGVWTVQVTPPHNLIPFAVT